MTNIELAKRYVSLVEDPRSTFESVRALMHGDLVWREMPNRFAPDGRSNSLAGVAEAAEAATILDYPCYHPIAS